MSKIETSEINTYFQDIDIDFIYAEISAIEQQVLVLEPLMQSPIEIFSPSPYKEEHASLSIFLKMCRQLKVVSALTVINKGLDRLIISAAKSDEAMQTEFEKNQVYLMYNLMLLYKLIGEFNQFVEDYPYIKRTKLADAQASFDKYEKFYDDYEVALGFTHDVFTHFYRIEKNRFFKIHKLIDVIETFCKSNGVAYPQDRNSKAFKKFYDGIKLFATVEAKRSGRSIKGYSSIDINEFSLTYAHLLKEL